MNAQREAIAARLQTIREGIQRASERRGPGPEVTLIAVSKRHPASAIRIAYEAGQRDFGENYAQEFRDKRRELEDLADIRWHFIGALQSNKIKYVAGHSLIHTLDREDLLPKLNQRALGQEAPQQVLIEVNFGERQKAGISPEQLPALLERFADYPALRCEGLMLIPPAGTPEQTRPHFRRLSELRDRLANEDLPGVKLAELSMGMSADFDVAIEEGSTLVRVGTAIFGPRPS